MQINTQIGKFCLEHFNPSIDPSIFCIFLEFGKCRIGQIMYLSESPALELNNVFYCIRTPEN